MRCNYTFLCFLGITILFINYSLVLPEATADEIWPGTTWQTKSPVQVQMNPQILDALANHVGGRGCVIRHGYLVYSWGDISARGDVASAAKTLYNHFVFKAIEDRKIPGIDSLVADFEPRLREINQQLQHKDANITWRHMTTQTSCYGLTEAPGTAFDYNDWQMALLWDTLFQKVYGANWDTVDKEVLHPLLTDSLQCEDNPTFMAFDKGDRPGRMAISPRDFARFGLLYLRQGNWQGQQLLSSESVRYITRSPVCNSIPRATGQAAEMIPGQRSMGSQTIPDNQCDHLGSYSFLWWVNGVDRDGQRHWSGTPTDAFGAFGHGGPRTMVVIPSLDVVISWNDARIDTREKEGKALKLLTDACTDRDMMQGQIIVDPERPDKLIRKGGGSYFMCGPGDPEDFLYRGVMQPDGTRDGDQMALIVKLAATGANCLYLQVIRSHGGDGDHTHNPFIGNNPKSSLNSAVLDQWEQWFTAMDQADICIYLFIYDDSASIWNTGDRVEVAEQQFIEELVHRFQHHKNLIWCIAEEYQERLSPARASAIARIIRENDDFNHPIAVHKLNGLDFSEFATDPVIDQFAVQYNVPTEQEIHEGMIKALNLAKGQYGINLSECIYMGTGAELRRKIWTTAMTGAHVMVLGMDVASTPDEDLYACGRVVRFMEQADVNELSPHNELAAGSTRYVLAKPGSAYVIYSPEVTGAVGVKDLAAGNYVMKWLDCATGKEVWQYDVKLNGSTVMFKKPRDIGDEIALWLKKLKNF